MKRYIKSAEDKFNGYKLVKSCTRELRPLIHDSNIRKNVTSIYLVYDPDSYNYDTDDYDEYYYFIFFKDDTVRNTYTDDYINYGTTAKAYKDKGPEYSINYWLSEIAYVD